jgi:hypothetical protein
VRCHDCADIPNQDPGVPGSRCNPAFGSKQTPIYASSELSVCLHGSELTGAANARVRTIRANCSAIGPNFNGHVVATANEDIAKVRGPGKLANSVLMTSQESNGLTWIANIKGADDRVNSSSCQNGITVFVPVVGKALGRLGWRWAVRGEG